MKNNLGAIRSTLCDYKKEQVLSPDSYLTSSGEGDDAVSCAGGMVNSICEGAGGQTNIGEAAE